MPAALNRGAYAELTTSLVPARDAFAYWREMICATFVRLVAEPVADAGFTGRIEHVAVGDLELSTVVAGSQHVRRTSSLIADSDEEYLLASIQVRGRGRVEQDGRTALLSPGDLAFYDSTRPYTLHFDDPFHQLVVQVPKRELLVRDTRQLTARTCGRGSPGAVVSTFFTSLAETAKTTPEHTSLLLPHALGLLSATASFAGNARPGPDAVEEMARARVLAFLRRHLADPRLDADAVAQGCHVSRRTLYRIVGAEGVAAPLRRMRIDHAQAILLAEPERTIGSVASACGFDSESGFHRAFRTVTGRSPGEYRRSGTPGR
ncbi:helix-turn-helix domain-containing protein [Amycolatopsis sp. NPDC051128]|uniref:AraC-like ligand-binding domain-containing protein n=1 Tax=Amycolatopsis sp. NPDC051128 TaxID=3155412 RepID=UPI00343F4F5C